MATRLVYAILLTAPHWSLTTAFFRFSCGILVTERVDPRKLGLTCGEPFDSDLKHRQC